jgi:hypothetical protein
MLEGIDRCGLFLHRDRFVIAAQCAENPCVQVEILAILRFQLCGPGKLLECLHAITMVEKIMPPKVGWARERLSSSSTAFLAAALACGNTFGVKVEKFDSH